MDSFQIVNYKSDGSTVVNLATVSKDGELPTFENEIGLERGDGQSYGANLSLAAASIEMDCPNATNEISYLELPKTADIVVQIDETNSQEILTLKQLSSFLLSNYRVKLAIVTDQGSAVNGSTFQKVQLTNLSAHPIRINLRFVGLGSYILPDSSAGGKVYYDAPGDTLKVCLGASWKVSSTLVPVGLELFQIDETASIGIQVQFGDNPYTLVSNLPNVDDLINELPRYGLGGSVK